jgi:hypothetical protein
MAEGEEACFVRGKEGRGRWTSRYKQVNPTSSRDMKESVQVTAARKDEQAQITDKPIRDHRRCAELGLLMQFPCC